MNTTELRLRQTIHYVQTELNRVRKVVPSNPIEKMHLNSAIEFYLGELRDLNWNLKQAQNA